VNKQEGANSKYFCISYAFEGIGTGNKAANQKKTNGFTSNSINEGKAQGGGQFAPSSGLGAFLIGKGSSGSLATF
jgi:hypothetical protein